MGTKEKYYSFLILNNRVGSVINTPNIATIIAKAVNKPNKIVGIKLDNPSTEKPNAIVKDPFVLGFGSN